MGLAAAGAGVAVWASETLRRSASWAFGLSTLLTLGWLLVLSVVPTHKEPGAAFLALIIIVVLVATLMIPRRANGRRYRWVRLLALVLLIAFFVAILAIFGVTLEVVGHGVSTAAVAV
ncbi:MAG: hypothetical protein PHV43_02720, partial [Candidatus Colwellbacteria bacterium]|nr:hypothetical protein [Candidatus Colwellbacteria bacterium]